MFDEKYEYLNKTGGTATVYFNSSTKEVENITANIISGHEDDFLEWVSKKTNLTLTEIEKYWDRYNPKVTTVTVEIVSDGKEIPLEKQQDYIDRACIEWAGRKDNFTTMEDFLERKFGYSHGQLIMPVSTFKAKLQEAFKKGLITKGENGRWTTK